MEMGDLSDKQKFALGFESGGFTYIYWTLWQNMGLLLLVREIKFSE